MKKKHLIDTTARHLGLHKPAQEHKKHRSACTPACIAMGCHAPKPAGAGK